MQDIVLRFTQDEILEGFNSYMENRPVMLKWVGTKDGQENIEVHKPPSLIDFSNWAQHIQSTNSKLKLLNYNKLLKTLEQDEFIEVKRYIEDSIEAEITSNALIKNYDSGFSKAYLTNKNGWSEKSHVTITAPIIKGIDSKINIDEIFNDFSDESEEEDE